MVRMVKMKNKSISSTFVFLKELSGNDKESLCNTFNGLSFKKTQTVKNSPPPAFFCVAVSHHFQANSLNSL